MCVCVCVEFRVKDAAFLVGGCFSCYKVSFLVIRISLNSRCNALRVSKEQGEKDAESPLLLFPHDPESQL